MRKVLISSGIEDIIPLGRVFRSLGFEAKVFDYNSVASPVDEYFFKPANNILRALAISREKPFGRNSRFRSDRYKIDKLRGAVKEFRPGILLVERGLAMPENFLQEIKREHGVKLTIAWWTKGFQWLDLAMKDAKLYDYYFFIHRPFAAECRNAGLNNCFYLPYAVDEDLFRKVELSPHDARKYRCDIVFVGGWYPNRQEIMERIVPDADIDLRIWGPKWRKKNIRCLKIIKAVQGSGLYGEELVRQYNAAKINLNISKWFGKSDSGLNLRVFEIPRCGGFLLTDHIEEIEEFYAVGKEIETYRSVEELREKIAFYLRNDSAREKIARRGYEKALGMPGWKDRITEMMDLISGRHVQ